MGHFIVPFSWQGFLSAPRIHWRDEEPKKEAFNVTAFYENLFLFSILFHFIINYLQIFDLWNKWINFLLTFFCPLSTIRHYFF